MDKNQVGSLSFEEFVLMNEVCGISITKKDLKRTFDIIDRSKNGRIRLEEIRSISSLIENEELDEE
jgi:Ca2+-binding EF-hand superfamily protein